MLMGHFDGDERAAVEMMRTFAGCMIRFPKRIEVETAVKARRAGLSLARDPSPGNARRLKELYGLSKKQFCEIRRANAARRDAGAVEPEESPPQ